MFKLQSEVSDLKKQETEIYTEIGKLAVAQYGLEGFGDVAERLRLVQANLAAAEGKLGAQNQNVCPACGFANAPGTRFCGVCGSRLEG